MRLDTLVIGYTPMENTPVDPRHIWDIEEIEFSGKKNKVAMNNLFKVGIRFDGYKNDDNTTGNGYDITYNNDFKWISSINGVFSTYDNKVISADAWICSMNLKSSVGDYDTMEMYVTPSSFSPSIKVTSADKAETLISILINTNAYQLIKYFSYQKSSIRTTMHLHETVYGRRNSAVGCVISYPNSIINSEYDDMIFRLVLKSRSTGELLDVVIYSDANGEISVVKYPVTQEEKRTIYGLLRSRRTDKDASDNFRVESRDVETSLVLVPEHNDIPLRMSHKADKFKCVIEVPDGLLLTNDSSKIIKYIDDKLPKNKMRRFKACTLVGRLFLPLDVVRHFRWLYVFKYDGDDLITCIKSP